MGRTKGIGSSEMQFTLPGGGDQDGSREASEEADGIMRNERVWPGRWLKKDGLRAM